MALLVLAAVCLAGLLGREAIAPVAGSAEAPGSHASIPLSFVPNRGQLASDRVRYHAQSPGFSIHLTQRMAAISLIRGDRGAAVHMRFIGANPHARLVADGLRSGTVNYISAAERHTGLPTYAGVTYRNLWPGIDMTFRTVGTTLKYQLVVRPGADPAAIRLAYAGGSAPAITAGGGLRVQTAAGPLTDSRPYSYQRAQGSRVPVRSRFVMRSARSHGFAVSGYDPRRPLVIDPVLSYSTFLGGGSSDEPFGIDTDSDGHAYVTGTTNSDNFPTTPGAFETTPGFFNAFVTKLSADGSALEYSTFITAPAEPRGIAVDRHGNAFVTGHTTSADFPTTPGAYDTSHNGGTYDVFLSKLNAAGSDLVYSTLLGGSSFEGATALTVGGEGSAYLTGNTASPDFPTTPGAFQAVNRGGNDIFVTRFNPAGSRLVYSTLLGSDSSNEFAYSLALDRAGNAYTTGRTDSAAFPTTPGTAGTGGGAGDDAFLSKVSPDGKRLLASTLIGGGGSEVGTGVATNGRDPYLAGITRDSPSFPTTPGAYDTTPNGGGDAFVMKLDPTLSRFAYSTLLGGAGGDSPGGTFGGHSLEVQRDRAHVTGQTGSSDFPATPGSTPSADGVFVTRFDPTGSQVTYSTVIGGSSLETSAGIALAAGGRDAYVAGMTDSSDFPTTAGAYDTHHDGTSDGFVAKLPLLPGSTTGCKVSGSGRIEASNGDRAKFAVGVRAPSDRSAQGVVQYSDKGPQERFKLFSFPIDALVCTGAGATITGEAIAGGEAVDFTIDVLDGGKTSPDTFRLRLSSGYDSGTQTVDPGSVRVQAP